MVQGHVDQVGACTQVETENGSWVYSFKYDASLGNLTIEKGSRLMLIMTPNQRLIFKT